MRDRHLAVQWISQIGVPRVVGRLGDFGEEVDSIHLLA